MNYKILFFLLFLFLNNCERSLYIDKKTIPLLKESFINKGFALVYSEELFDKKIVSKKLENRSMIIFQMNLKKDTYVKIKNISNNKVIVAQVGVNSKYPKFNNSVLSKRIADDLELDLNEPYIEIIEILENSSFIAKKTKTYDEEKKVANKAPIDDINFENLNEINVTKKISKKTDFNYYIKIADFYFKDNGLIMIDKIKTETVIKDVNIFELSKNQFRVSMGPFNNIKSLQKAFNDINILEFENIEIIKND
jgi:hypothetical protein